MTPVKSKRYTKEKPKPKAKSASPGAKLPRKAKETAINTLPVPAGDRDLLQRYFQEIARTSLLSPEEERRLALQWFNSQDKKAFQTLVQSNLRFVVKIAFEYARYGARVLDLIQEGNMGLMKAVRDFNPHKEVRVTTYAVWWIRSYIQDFLLRNWSLVRVGTTTAQKKLFYRLKKEQQRMEHEGLSVEPKAIAMNLGVEESDVKLMQERLSGRDVSLSAPLTHEDSPNESLWINRMPDQSPLVDAELSKIEQSTLFKKALKEFMTQLDERELSIFKERLMSETPKTLLEIGKDYGFTKERARQLEERIKSKLKEFLSLHYPDISIN